MYIYSPMVYFLVQFIYHWYIYTHIDTYIDTWSIFGSPQKTNLLLVMVIVHKKKQNTK